MVTTFLLVLSMLVPGPDGDDIRIAPQYRLIAHRGGVVDSGKNPENSIAALDEAISRGYAGVEIDARMSRDGVVFLYHNATFAGNYDSTGRGSEMTWEQIQALRPLRPGLKPPVSMEEYLRHASGRLTDVMVDIKVDDPAPEFYRELERILRETGFLGSSYFFGHGEYFRGKGPKSSMNLSEREEFFETWGERSKDYFFLFAGIDEINARTVEWAQRNGIMVMCCENLPFRGEVPSDNIPRAGRNFRWLQSLGVTCFQLDSAYDIFFREEQP
jgi:glycerophosphoryl diester phosphodiesterase